MPLVERGLVVAAVTSVRESMAKTAVRHPVLISIGGRLEGLIVASGGAEVVGARVLATT